MISLERQADVKWQVYLLVEEEIVSLVTTMQLLALAEARISLPILTEPMKTDWTASVSRYHENGL